LIFASLAPDALGQLQCELENHSADHVPHRIVDRNCGRFVPIVVMGTMRWYPYISISKLLRVCTRGLTQGLAPSLMLVLLESGLRPIWSLVS
jgi:hypothetical protein